MSQRGGAVTTVVRFGAEPVATMVADHGCVDCVVSFETTEALRNLPFVREGGYRWWPTVTSNRCPCSPVRPACLKTSSEKLQVAAVLAVPAGPIAEQVVATSKSVNVVLPGALATRLDFGRGMKEVISKRVPPKTVEANLRAFDAGYEFARKGAE